MRGMVVAATIGLWCLVPGIAAAQEQKNPEELKKLYDEAVTQLKAAQDRKNELAAENEKLSTRIAELETRLSQKNIEAAGYAERTWFLRAHYAAWQRFIDRYPAWKTRWQAFLAADPLDPFNELSLEEPAPLAG